MQVYLSINNVQQKQLSELWEDNESVTGIKMWFIYKRKFLNYEGN